MEIVKTPRKIFTVWIHEKPYDVYDIDGKEHGGWNGEPKTWWLYYSDRMPDGASPPVDSEHWHAFHASINRRVWDIQIKQRNTTKYKWDETQFRNNTWVEMRCNGRLVYDFGTTGNDSGLAFAMAKVQYLMVHMSEHPYNFFEPEKENGRKIYWKGLPATIRVKGNTWEVMIIPDYTCGYTREQWWKELENRESKLPPKRDDDFDEIDKEDKQEAMRDDAINWGDALSDQYIDWFRKD